jgi:hypothetical protein
MFYSELLSSPINTEDVKHTYGINPDTEPDRAIAIGVYPLTEVPEGYRALAYIKDGDSYTAVSSTITIAEEQMVDVIRTAQTTLAELREALALDDY